MSSKRSSLLLVVIHHDVIKDCLLKQQNVSFFCTHVSQSLSPCCSLPLLFYFPPFLKRHQARHSPLHQTWYLNALCKPRCIPSSSSSDALSPKFLTFAPFPLIGTQSTMHLKPNPHMLGGARTKEPSAPRGTNYYPCLGWHPFLKDTTEGRALPSVLERVLLASWIQDPWVVGMDIW